MSTPDTRQAIMHTARRMVQAGGYGSLSFRDLAAAVGVKSSSVHYHFPTKGDLATALAQAYIKELRDYLAGLQVTAKTLKKCMAQYTDIFRNTLLQDNRMCMCGMLASQRDELPLEVLAEVNTFTDANVEWLTHALTVGHTGSASDGIRRRALGIFAAVEGAQLVARARGKVSVYDDAVAAFRLAGLIP